MGRAQENQQPQGLGHAEDAAEHENMKAVLKSSLQGGDKEASMVPGLRMRTRTRPSRGQSSPMGCGAHYKCSSHYQTTLHYTTLHPSNSEFVYIEYTNYSVCNFSVKKTEIKLFRISRGNILLFRSHSLVLSSQ